MKDFSDYKKALVFAAWGAGGGVVSGISFDLLLREPLEPYHWPSVTAWFGTFGAFISVALLVGQSWYFQRGVQLPQALRAGVLPGFLAGAIASAIAQTVYSINYTEFLRVVAWTVAGSLLGFGISRHIPNLGHWRGLGGGAAGGCLGGCLFIALSALLTDFYGRFLGLGIIAFFIGLMIILAEKMFQKAELIVHWTPIKQGSMSLGETPISLGSSKKSDIFLIGDGDFPETAGTIHVRDGRIVFENLMERHTSDLRHGDQFEFGGLRFEIRTDQQPEGPSDDLLDQITLLE